MILYTTEGKRFDFSTRAVRDKAKRYFGTMSQRDDYAKFIEGLWDTIECDEFILPLPEIDGVD